MALFRIIKIVRIITENIFLQGTSSRALLFLWRVTFDKSKNTGKFVVPIILQLYKKAPKSVIRILTLYT